MKLNKFYPTITKFGTNTIYIFSTLILILNFFSGIIGGLWILFVGGWKLIVSGIVISVLMPYGWSIVSMPQLALTPFLIKAEERGNKFWVATFGFIANFYGNVLIVLWISFSLNFFMEYRSQYPLIPLLLLGYSVALGPLQYMAQKEGPESSGSFMGVFLAQIVYIVPAVIVLFGGVISLTILIVIALIFSIFNTTIATLSMSPSVASSTNDFVLGKCSKCGADTTDDALSCINCGYKLK